MDLAVTRRRLPEVLPENPAKIAGGPETGLQCHALKLQIGIPEQAGSLFETKLAELLAQGMSHLRFECRLQAAHGQSRGACEFRELKRTGEVLAEVF